MLSKITERPSRLWHRQKERYGKRRAAALLVLVIATVAIFAGGTATVVYAAYAPRAVIVGYGDRATSGLRGSELLEVSTSGFAENATLQYTYDVTNYTYKNSYEGIYGIRFFDSPNVSVYAGGSRTSGGSPGTWVPANTNQEIHFSGVGYAWFSSMQDIKSARVTVTVVDINSNSPTYNRTATAKYTGFNTRNLAADVAAGGYGMFAGSTCSLRDDILSAGGVVGIDLNNSTSAIDTGITISPSDNITAEYSKEGTLIFTVYDYHIKADVSTAGRVVQMSVPINSKLCSWHWWQKPTVTFSVRIFKPFGYTAKLHQITVTSTEKGVTYTINGESQTCQRDGEALTFGTKNPLDADTTYSVSVYTTVNGKKMTAYTVAKTANTCVVKMDYLNGLDSVTDGREKTIVDYGNTMQEFTDKNTPTAYGYVFGGWYDNAACTGDDYRNVKLDADEIKLYAKWTAKKYDLKLNLSKDGNAYDNAEVTLCQNGKAMYTLEQVTSEIEGVSTYHAANVQYSPYLNENGTRYSYDIYVNGTDSGLNLALDGEAEDGSEQEANVYCTSVYVDLSLDGTPWGGQEVVIDNNSGTTYVLSDTGANGSAEHYEYIFAYDTKTPEVNDYQIYLNGELIQDWTDESMTNKSQVTIPINKTTEEAHGTSQNFYNVTVSVKKDDEIWKDAVVTLCQGGGIMKTLVYDSNSQTFGSIVGSRFSYDLLVDGIYTGNDTSENIADSNKTVALNYYTVSFIDGMDTTQKYYEQIVQSGLRAGKPTAPFKEGRSFMGWYTGKDTTQDNVTQIFRNSTSSDAITAPLTLYAVWQQPELIIGDYIKCTAEGTMDGKGTQYRLSNLTITGYPVAEGDYPMVVAQLSVNRSVNESTNTATEDIITILGNDAANQQAKGTTSSSYYSYEYDGKTYYYMLKKERSNESNTYSFYLYHGEDSATSTGWPRAVLQEFLRTQLVVEPKTLSSGVTGQITEAHYCDVKVFGTTATTN